MLNSILFLALACPGLLAPGPAPGAGHTQLHWRGEKHDVDAPPAELPAPAAEVLALWGPWAVERDYQLCLDEPGRVLYVAENPSSRALKLIGRTTEFFDSRLPAPERGPPAGATAARTSGPGGAPPAAARGGNTIPEDPESGGLGTSLSEALNGTPKWETVWGAGTGELDRATIVILALDMDTYGEALERLVEQDATLSGWARASRSSLGFVLESPLVGAWVYGDSSNEEWDPDGELVHRLTDLLLMRRFGRQPYWMVQGIAWHAEMKLRRGIWCYPFRDEFVYTVEHAGWSSDVRNGAKKKFKKSSVTTADLTALKRGAWNGEGARMAYGSMAWMMENRSEGLVLVLEDLRVAYDEGNRVDKGGGLWERDINYEVPDSVVARLFHEHLGDDVYDELTEGLKSFR